MNRKLLSIATASAFSLVAIAAPGIAQAEPSSSDNDTTVTQEALDPEFSVVDADQVATEDEDCEETEATLADQSEAEQEAPAATANGSSNKPAEDDGFTPKERKEYELRKEEMSTEQAKLSIGSIKTVLKIALFFSGVGAPLALLL